MMKLFDGYLKEVSYKLKERNHPRVFVNVIKEY